MDYRLHSNLGILKQDLDNHHHHREFRHCLRRPRGLHQHHHHHHYHSQYCCMRKQLLPTALLQQCMTSILLRDGYQQS